jgi:N-acetylglucosamine-6-sulfatase
MLSKPCDRQQSNWEIVVMSMASGKSLIATALSLILFCAPAQSGPVKPNIIVIMTDDQDDGPLFAMPHTKAFLVDHGTRFTNSFVSQSTCGPSRVSFLTGQYVHNHGATNNSAESYRVFQRRESDTLAVWLQKAGYKTAMIGKFINGYKSSDPIPAGWNEWNVSLEDSYYEYDLNENGRIVHYGNSSSDYSTDVLAKKAVRFVANEGSKPFFMIVGTRAPHKDHGMPPIPARRDTGKFDALQLSKAPDFNERDVTDKPTVTRNLPILTRADVGNLTIHFRKQEESLIAVDDLIEAIRNALISKGALQNTMLILTSDNGYMLGEHRWMNTKGVTYENSIRVPLLMRGPGIAHGDARTQLVSNVDLTATILQWAGALAEHKPNLDGRSLHALLERRALN